MTLGEKKTPPVCLLGRVPGPDGSECSPDLCRHCGWDPDESRRRKAIIYAGMMVKDADGISRLILRK